MRQAVPTRVELPEHLAMASILRSCLRVQALTEWRNATVPAEQARTEAGQAAEPAFCATWVLPCDADPRHAG